MKQSAVGAISSAALLVGARLNGRSDGSCVHCTLIWWWAINYPSLSLHLAIGVQWRPMLG